MTGDSDHGMLACNSAVANIHAVSLLFRDDFMKRLPVYAMLMALSGTPAFANDSSAAIAAGGLVLVKNDQVRMVSEILRIAPRLVEVDYVFENTGRTDVTTEVAFPLPDLHQAPLYNSPFNIPFANDPNFVGFQVWSDGQEIKPGVEVRAFVSDSEITSELKRLNVDLVAPRVDNPQTLSSETIATLLRLGALNSADERGMFAVWTTKVSLHWPQVFPAGKQIAVRHRYRPAYGNYYIFQESAPTKDSQTSGGPWCLDPDFNAAELRLFRRLKDASATKADRERSSPSISYENVQYVLKTGANWQGPIGRFELQIDKGGASLVSTCPIPGLQLQRTAYGFKAVATNYMPINDLDILFVSDHWLGQPDGSAEAPR